MISIKRTNSDDNDFRELVKALDEELKIRDGEDFELYAELNRTAYMQYAVVTYDGKEPAGCGAFREYEPGIMEMKRVFVPLHKRQLGIASAIIKELESWCRELGTQKCVLETGKNQPEAIALYKKHDYVLVPNFGKYTDSENSVCFVKELK